MSIQQTMVKVSCDIEGCEVTAIVEAEITSNGDMSGWSEIEISADMPEGWSWPRHRWNGKIDLTWSKTEDLEKHICTECRVKEDSEFARLVAENNP